MLYTIKSIFSRLLISFLPLPTDNQICRKQKRLQIWKTKQSTIAIIFKFITLISAAYGLHIPWCNGEHRHNQSRQTQRHHVSTVLAEITLISSSLQASPSISELTALPAPPWTDCMMVPTTTKSEIFWYKNKKDKIAPQILRILHEITIQKITNCGITPGFPCTWLALRLNRLNTDTKLSF